MLARLRQAAAARRAAVVAHPFVVEGQGKSVRNGGRRTQMVIAIFLAMYGAIGGRLVHLGLQAPEDEDGPAVHRTAARPDIVDRNGAVLATDIKMFSLFAEPRRILDPDETVEKLSTVLPDLDMEDSYRKLKSGKGFVWLRRQLSPRQQNDIMGLGLPGIGFRAALVHGSSFG